MINKLKSTLIKINLGKRKLVPVFAGVILATLPVLFYTLYASQTAQAAWMNDNWNYRKKLTIENTGSADTNKRVKFDIETAELVENETINFNSTTQTFTAGMAKRTAPGPFAAAPIVQGDWSLTETHDVISFGRGSQISGNFYETFDGAQGSISFWFTPEYDTPFGRHYILRSGSSWNILLYIEGDVIRFRYYDGAWHNFVSSALSWTAGTTYYVVVRWDTNNTLDGTNYMSISVNDTHEFGISDISSRTSPGDPIYFGVSSARQTAADAIIEGLTVYRRPLFDGTRGIDVGNGDEIAAIYDATPANATDPTLVTGSWDVVFALPTDQSLGTLSTGTGEAWSHPHSSNLLYTDTTNTGGFMMNGTYTTDGWADEGTPSSVAALADSEKIFAGGYKTTSDAANEGIYYSETVSAGNDWVIRALGHSDGTCDPKVILYDQTGTAEIGSIAGTTTSDRDTPDVYLFTGEAPSGSTELRVKLVNTAASGTCYWHQVELQTNRITNPSVETGSGDPWAPTSWSNASLDAGDTEQETTVVHSGSSSVQYNSGANSNEGYRIQVFGSSGSFYGFDTWVYGTGSNSLQIGDESTGLSLLQHSATVSKFTAPTSASWSHAPGVLRIVNDRINFNPTGGNAGPIYLDDVSVIPMDAVSLTITPATEANSTESSGLRVDGRDTSVQSTSNLSTSQGTIKFNYTPRHSAADALKFLESTDVYIGEWYGDADDYLQLYWSAANTVTLAYSMGGTTGSDTWNATGLVDAGTTYEFVVAYDTTADTLTLDVDGSTDEISISLGASDVFGTAPSTAHWGKRNSGSDDRQADATYSKVTITDANGDKMQGDCGDIKVTDINGKLLDYYLDTSTADCNTESTDLWVLVPEINANDDTILYLYYGNPTTANGGQGSQFSEAEFTPNSTSIATEEIGPGPVLYYKFDEGADNTCDGGEDACDSTTNANDGTFGATTAAPTWQSEDMCVDGKCLNYDGSNDYIDLGTQSDLNPTTLTISAWIKSNDTTNTTTSIWVMSNSGANTYRGFWGDEDELEFGWGGPAGHYRQYKTSTSPITENRWHHVVVVQSDTSAPTFYVDGAEQTSALSLSSGDSNFQSTQEMSVGRFGGHNNFYFNGFIDEIKIYPYARSAAEIKEDFNRGAQVLGINDESYLSDGLVGYWKMDEASADTCTGATNDSCDSSGNGNDGAWQADATTVAGKFGNGTTYDGTTDFTEVSNNYNPSSVTFSTWFKADNVAGGRQRILNKYLGAGDGWGITIDSGSVVKIYNDIDGVDASLYSTSITDDTWYHAVATMENLEQKLYINGELVGSGTNASDDLSSFSGNFYMGARRNDGAESFDGQIDEVRLFNRALSPAEVEKLYNWAPGPVVHYSFDENQGNTAYAQSTYNPVSGTDLQGEVESESGGSDGPIWTTGKFGSALEFDGVNDWVEVQDHDALEMGYHDFTYTFWVNVNDFSSPLQPGIMSREGAFSIYFSSNTLVYNFSGESSTYGTSANTDEWNHFAIALDRDVGSSVYMNGVLVDTDSDFTSLSNTDLSYAVHLRLGNSSSTRKLNGKLDEFKLYNYALNTKQIVQDMNAGHPAPGSPVGSALGHWKFDEGYGDTAYDSGTGGNNGDLAGGTSCPQSGDSACPTWTNSGKFGKALDFEETGTFDYIDLGSSATYRFTTEPFTVSVWIKKESSGGNIIISNDDNTNGWSVVDSNDNFRFVTRGTSDSYTDSTIGMNTGEWYHLVAVYTGTDGERILYINGRRSIEHLPVVCQYSRDRLLHL